MAPGEVFRLYAGSEEELRVELCRIGFGDTRIGEIVQLVLDEVGNFQSLDVITVFLTPDDLVILPEKRLEVCAAEGKLIHFPLHFCGRLSRLWPGSSVEEQVVGDQRAGTLAQSGIRGPAVILTLPRMVVRSERLRGVSCPHGKGHSDQFPR